jgi:hypothetical protein
MFEFPTLDEATLEAVREIKAERAVYQRKEALQLYYTLSRDFRDAFSELEIFVLKPVCVSCANQRSFGWSSNKSTIVSVLPGYRPQQLRIYDMSNNELHFFPYERGEDEGLFRITCTHCRDYADEGNEDGDELVLVEPESFCEYFGVEEEGRKSPDGDLRKEIRELYGHACYACGVTEKITVDHIMPKSVEGQAIPTNLQLLCEKCNGEKADSVPKRLILALDFLMRPAPWDSYEGLIW